LKYPEAWILSGGVARRAGGINKSFMPLHGRPIIEHQLESLKPSFSSINIVTDRPDDFEGYGLNTFTDKFKRAPICAMRGLASALSQASTDFIFVLAGDMPWPDTEIAEIQLRRLQAAKSLGCALRDDSGPQPFHAWYHIGMAGDLASSLKTRRLSLQDWILSNPAILQISAEELGVSRGRISRCLQNFNTLPSA
jgi:molybdopterin-guanine dinucleotide biosynthesis protein A